MDFYQRMRMVCLRIPEGRVATYGQIALLCGKPKNSRQVGYGLRCMLAGNDIPAHRVVNGKGILSGACYFATWETQKLLLMKEGVEVLESPEGWKVDLKRYRWEQTLEEAYEFYRLFQDCQI